jgi:hypothetical protein
VLRIVGRIAVGLFSGGCAVGPQPQHPAHQDYAAMSCSELINQSKQLLRNKTDRSEYLLEDSQADTAPKIAAVRKAIRDKSCSV